MKKLEIIGDNCFGHWEHERTACRGIVVRGNDILLSYETRTGQYMLPGGGLEADESQADCCRREVAEETGVVVDPGDCVLEIDEYYEDWKYVSLYFICAPAGACERRGIVCYDEADNEDHDQQLRTCGAVRPGQLQLS